MDARKYEQLAKDQWDEIGIYIPYWNILPECLISICPFTGEPHTQLLDTFSLIGWRRCGFSNEPGISFSPQGYRHSAHLIADHAFLNLNGRKPTKRELMGETLTSTEPEVPMITPALLPDDSETIVVLNSLPVTRLHGQSFKSAYTLYVLSYYARNPGDVLERRKQMWTNGRELAFTTWGAARKCIYWEEATAECWDLQHWLQRGKLLWLDEDKLSSEVDSFPYKNIQGLRHGYEYDPATKSITIVPTRVTIEAFQADDRYFKQTE